MHHIDTVKYKAMLEKAKGQLESELDRLGNRNPLRAEDWDVRMPDIDTMSADENESADRSEAMQIDSIVLDELEARYRNILRALKKIEDGTYGICEVSGEPIEEDRLEANPAARTTKAHIREEDSLPA